MLSQVKMHDGKGNEMIWLLEHNDIYTGGTSSKQSDLKNTKNIKISKTNRGGQWTWHGPGQRIVYFVLDLNMRNKDVRWFVNKLEQLIINALLDFNINSKEGKFTWVGFQITMALIKLEQLALELVNGLPTTAFQSILIQIFQNTKVLFHAE